MNVTELIAKAQTGDAAARDALLERCRPYLQILARTKVETWLRSKFDGSDLVQQTLLEAYRAFETFGGQTEEEWLAWLKQILTHNSQDVIRQYRTDKRAAQRERSLQSSADSSLSPQEPAADWPSPSRLLMRREDDLALAEALAQLPPDHQEVLQLRSLQRLPFEEVAERMGRSRGAVQMLWARAVKKLEERLAGRAETES